MAVCDELARKLMMELPEADVKKVTEDITELKGIAPSISAAVV